MLLINRIYLLSSSLEIPKTLSERLKETNPSKVTTAKTFPPVYMCMLQ